MKLNSAVLTLLLLLSIIYGTTYITQPASAEGAVKTIGIGLYWDEECINPVHFVDLGMLGRGHDKSVTFWLRNYGTEKGRFNWASANFNPSTDGIAGYWERKVGRFNYISNWDKKIKPEELWQVHYIIQVAQDAQVGVCSWDMIVCFIVSGKITCLSVACSLMVTQ